MKRAITIMASITIALASNAALAAALPDPTHYRIEGDTIYMNNATSDSDLAILDSHPGLKHIETGPEAWDGPDPRTVPIKITDRGFAHLAKCKQLQTLQLSCLQPLQVTDEGLKFLEGLKELRVLQLGVTPFSSAGLNHLAGLTNLEELWLDLNPQYDDAALEPIANLKKLRVLRFHGSPITDAGIATIRGLSQLEDLQLGKARIGDDSFKIIANFTKLKTLDLQHTRVTDAGMEYAKRLTQLQWLCLKGTAVTRKGLENLADMPQLKSLYLDKLQADKLPPELASKVK